MRGTLKSLLFSLVLLSPYSFVFLSLLVLKDLIPKSDARSRPCLTCRSNTPMKNLTRIKYIQIYVDPPEWYNRTHWSSPPPQTYAYRHPFHQSDGIKKNSEEAWPRRTRQKTNEKKQIARKEFFVSSSSLLLEPCAPSFFPVGSSTLYLISSFLRLFLLPPLFPPPSAPLVSPSNPMIEKFFCWVFISLQPCDPREKKSGWVAGNVHICIRTRTLGSFARLSFCWTTCYVAAGMLLKLDEHGKTVKLLFFYFFGWFFFSERSNIVIAVIITFFRMCTTLWLLEQIIWLFELIYFTEIRYNMFYHLF